MRTSELAIKQIAAWEGIKYRAYTCPAGKPTTGVGHLIKANEQHLMTKKLSPAEVYALLAEDIKETEGYVRAHFGDGKLSQSQFDAAVSFCFNAGIGNLRKSIWAQLLINGKAQEAAEALEQWGSKQWTIAPGLKTRRAMEAQWLLR